jgi:hypothetical protein
MDISKSNEKPKIIPHPNLMIRNVDEEEEI